MHRLDRRGQLLAARAADLDALEARELLRRRRRGEQLVAARHVAVEARKDGGRLEAPRVAGALGRRRRAVRVVLRLERAEHAQHEAELVDRLGRVGAQQVGARREAARLVDEVAADAAQQRRHARRRVEVPAVAPHEQRGVQDRPEEVGQRGKVVERREALEVGAQRREEARVARGLGERRLDVGREALKRRVVRAARELERARDLAHALAAELLVQRREALGALAPKVELGERPGVHGCCCSGTVAAAVAAAAAAAAIATAATAAAVATAAAGVRRRVCCRRRRRRRRRVRAGLQHALDLLRPRDDRRLEQVHALNVGGRELPRPRRRGGRLVGSGVGGRGRVGRELWRRRRRRRRGRRRRERRRQRRRVGLGQRQQRLPLGLADRDLDVGDKLVQPLGHLARDDVGPSLLAVRAAE